MYNLNNAAHRNVLFFIIALLLVPSVIPQGHKLTEVVIKKPRYVGSPALTCADIRYIVDFHNDARRMLANGSRQGQPKASNMQRMVWDARLADIAQNWTKRMIFGHNSERYDSRYIDGAVGENLFMTSSNNAQNKRVEWNRPLNGWYNEHNFYQYTLTFDDPITGHYTQMIWANTIHVGCGTSQFMDENNWLYKYYVCNYGPSGNWIGNFPYAEEMSIDELEALLESGFIIDSSLFLTCENLCCDYNQCKYKYGNRCT